MKNKRIFNLGLIILIFIFNMMLIPSVFFIFKVSIPILNVILSIIITILSYVLILKKDKATIKEMLLSNIILILFILISIFISGQIYDTTYDSNTYHKNAVGAIANGWNPVYESIDEFYKSDDVPFKTNYTYGIWNDHYAKGYYIYAGNIYNITGNIETGKSIYLLTILSTFLICFTLINSKHKKIFSILLSLLIAFNPVTISQFNTFYNDGLLGNFLILLILSLMKMIKKDKSIDKYKNYLLYFTTLTILINIKFTGFAYAGIFSLFFYVYILFNKTQRKENLKSLTIIAIMSLIIGTGIIGLSTYPKNVKDHAHPFYPLYGENKVDIMEGNTPAGLSEMNRIERFIVANFSKTYNSMNKDNKQYKIKIPFTFSVDELKYYIGPDVRVGGYGVFFGGLLIIGSLLLILNLIKSIKEKKECAYYLLPILATLFIILIIKDAWWARYLPILYCFPILMLMEYKSNKVITIIITSLLIINSGSVAGPIILNIIDQNAKVNESFNVLKETESKEVVLIDNELSGAFYNIYDKYNNITIIKNMEENTDTFELMGNRIKIKGYIK